MKKPRGHFDPRGWLPENEGTVLVLPFLTFVRRYTYPFMGLGPTLSPGMGSSLRRQRDLPLGKDIPDDLGHERQVELHESLQGEFQLLS